MHVFRILWISWAQCHSQIPKLPTIDQLTPQNIRKYIYSRSLKITHLIYDQTIHATVFSTPLVPSISDFLAACLLFGRENTDNSENFSHHLFFPAGYRRPLLFLILENEKYISRPFFQLPSVLNALSLPLFPPYYSIFTTQHYIILWFIVVYYNIIHPIILYYTILYYITLYWYHIMPWTTIQDTLSSHIITHHVITHYTQQTIHSPLQCTPQYSFPTLPPLLSPPDSCTL